MYKLPRVASLSPNRENQERPTLFLGTEERDDVSTNRKEGAGCCFAQDVSTCVVGRLGRLGEPNDTRVLLIASWLCNCLV